MQRKQSTQTLTDRSNQDATIGFVIYYPFQFYVYKNVYKHLYDQAEFIIDLGVFFPNRQTEDILPALEELLTKHGARYRVLQYDDYRYASYLEKFFSKYEVLVSVWWRGSITRSENLPRKKVQITYGAGKELTQFDLRKTNFDLVLAYGEYDHGFYSLITKSVIVGNPKFDDWFNESIDMSDVMQVTERLDPKKKTILYLPTHSDLSSIDMLAETLKRIAGTYNLVVKLHYYTPREEPWRVEALTHPRIILLKDDADLLPLLKIADVVVSDNSSAIFDAVLANKPIVVTDFHSSEYLDTAHRGTRVYRRGVGGALTFSGSIEQRIKRDGTVQTITVAKELLPTVERVFVHDTAEAKRKELAKKLFAHRDGSAGRRGAESIRAFAKASIEEKPFLYHAIQHYTTNVLRRPKRSLAWLEEYLPIQEDFRRRILEEETGVVFSVIVLPHKSEYRPQALRSVGEQDFPKERYELIEVLEGETLGTHVACAIAESKGRIICFATDDCVLPSDWLSTLYLAYERNPQIGGAGGYVCAAMEASTPFDEYRHRQIARTLGVPIRREFLSEFYEVVNQLPDHNPAGALSAISYRKSLIPSIKQIRSNAQLEHFLRMVIMRKAPVCFVPQSVTRLSKMLQVDFLLEEHERALAKGFQKRLRRWFRKIFHIRRFLRSARVALLARTAHTLGAIQARILRWL